MHQQFEIKTSAFQGPLEVLLQMIEKRKVFVNDVSLADVADDFVAYVEQNEGISPELSSNFIVVASTLVLIKSKSLLPHLTLTDEEQSNIDELEHRLRLYQIYKKRTQNMKEMFGTHRSLLPTKRSKQIVQPSFSPGGDVTIPSILSSIQNVISRVPRIEDIPQATVETIVRLEDMVERLIDRVQSSLKTSFKEFTGNEGDKKNVIVSFLALLELVKRGLVHAQQEKQFNDIEMETSTIGTPSY